MPRTQAHETPSTLTVARRFVFGGGDDSNVITHPSVDPLKMGKTERELASELVQIQTTVEQIKRAAAHDIAEICRDRDQMLSDCTNRYNTLKAQIDDVRSELGSWVSQHGVNGTPVPVPPLDVPIAAPVIETIDGAPALPKQEKTA